MFNWLFKKAPAVECEDPRKVILIDIEGRTVIVEAEPSQCGWIASKYSNAYTINILLPEGKVAGYPLVESWLPHSGWDGTEFKDDSKQKEKGKISSL